MIPLPNPFFNTAFKLLLSLHSHLDNESEIRVSITCFSCLDPLLSFLCSQGIALGILLAQEKVQDGDADNAPSSTRG
jgi:hypothetical protein